MMSLIPTANTFYEAVSHLLVAPDPSEGLWCDGRMWTDHSVTYDFRVHKPIGSLWGLPHLIPTCPTKLFAQSVRLKYVDIVTDILHASSRDLITWNTLAMTRRIHHSYFSERFLLKVAKLLSLPFPCHRVDPVSTE